jgi:glycosyltransferase involved in cell wall biosynthesis
LTDAASISVCVVCRNEADRLGACLESARWADEIVVLDLSSTDDSAQVAREHGARVIEHDPVPIVELVRNEVAGAATGDWILALDPDERIAEGLPAELRRLSGREDVDAVAIPVMNHDFGYPASNPIHRFDPKIRFYRRDRVTWPTEPNTLPEVEPARLHRLPNRDDLVLVHERNRTIPEALDRILRYAPAEAQARIDAGETFTARRMIRRLAQKTRKQFIEARAFDDGVPGLIRASVLVAFDFYVWAAFWQMSGARRTPEDDRYVRMLGRTVQAAWSTVRVARAPLRVARRLERGLGRGREG